MKISAVSRAVFTLFAGLALTLPASAQNFPFPSSRSGGSIGIGDVINIIGGSRGGNVNVGRSRGSDRAQAAIGIAGAIYDIAQRGQQPRYNDGYPVNYPGNGYPGNGYPNGNFPAYPGNGYPGGNTGYNDGYNTRVNIPGNNYPGNRYPNNSSRNGQPGGYAFIENAGLPVHLDPQVFPLTLNGGGGRGDAVLAEAIQTWNNAGIGQVFALTNGNADLHIDWSGQKVSRGARAETRMIRSDNFVLPTDLSVRTEGRSPEQITRVVTHELGHVLGLDHSQSRDDVMFASEEYHAGGLSQRDLAMVRWLYAQQRYSPVVGRSDVQGAPPVANNFNTHGLADGESMCSMHDH